MTKDQIKRIEIRNESILEVVETHISWVVIGSEYVYKIKKPVNYGFVDFSSLEKRKYYCEQELLLNNRLTENMYLDIVGICLENEKYVIESKCRNVKEYAVKMVKKDLKKQMHLLLEENRIKGNDIIAIARKIASFHKTAEIIATEFSSDDFITTFNDIENVLEFVRRKVGIRYSKIISDSIDYSNQFIHQYTSELKGRVNSKMIRDCHGDLHSGNIFIEDEPVIFDCIEFNPAFRQIDLLYEIAFFCMDLDSFGRRDLGKLFMNEYTKQFPEVLVSNFDKKLFIYYKLCRANIKAKVIALKILQLDRKLLNPIELDELKRYIRLMLWYHHELINR